MAFETIDVNTIKVGDPITKELLDLIKANLDDLDERLNQSETTGGAVNILNQEINLAGLPTYDPFVFYFKAPSNFTLSEVRAQIFDKGSIAFGALSLDVQKSTDTNDANFNSVLSSDLSFNFASDPSYTSKVATINSSVSNFSTGNVLRVEITSLPSNFGGKILLYIGAE
jgi:hypothetical protein